ncbi:alpha/beta hydrolase [Granulicoccus sp. GXG6511]|uniref:alpha/beta hydrolase n=1 Tax=Granulicoccus sp. GXG6511 TaxID=3381351 RepID=UPI003D7DC571
MTTVRWRSRPTTKAGVRENAVGFTGGSGRVGVVLCHGITGSPFSLRAFADHLVAEGYRVALPLLPGHGTSWQQLNRTSWHDWFAVVDGALRALRRECDEVFVMGISMGGALALRLAQVHPDDVRGIVLVNPSLGTADKRYLFLPFLSRFVPSLAGITDDIAKPDVTEHGYDRVPLKAVVSMMDLWTTVRADLPRVEQPILMFRSETDHVVDDTSARIIHHSVASAEVTERLLTRSFHVATLDFEAEDIFSESVDFIRGHSAFHGDAPDGISAGTGVPDE